MSNLDTGCYWSKHKNDIPCMIWSQPKRQVEKPGFYSDTVRSPFSIKFYKAWRPLDRPSRSPSLSSTELDLSWSKVCSKLCLVISRRPEKRHRLPALRSPFIECGFPRSSVRRCHDPRHSSQAEAVLIPVSWTISSEPSSVVAQPLSPRSPHTSAMLKLDAKQHYDTSVMDVGCILGFRHPRVSVPVATASK